jgi:hypothetical protein
VSILTLVSRGLSGGGARSANILEWGRLWAEAADATTKLTDLVPQRKPLAKRLDVEFLEMVKLQIHESSAVDVVELEGINDRSIEVL